MLHLSWDSWEFGRFEEREIFPETAASNPAATATLPPNGTAKLRPWPDLGKSDSDRLPAAAPAIEN